MADNHFRYRGRPIAINPAFEAPIDDPSRYDGDESDNASSDMSGPSTNPGHQLATSGFEPIVPQATHSELERIEARLRELEREEEMRTASRTNVLFIRRDHDAHIAMKRKREDDEFRAITEKAEEEEEELRKKKRKLKRESMGLFVFSQKNSPEVEPAPITAPAQPQTQAPSQMQAPMTLSAHHTPTLPSLQPSNTPPSPHPQLSQYSRYAAPSRSLGTGSAPQRRSSPSAPVRNGVRQRKKYSVRNPDIYDNRHGPAEGFDNVGRPLWKRPSDHQLVYLSCPLPDCRKSDFRTLHGFTCHMTRVHKDSTSRRRSEVIETFGSETPVTRSSEHAYPQPPLPAENPVPENYEPATYPAQNHVQEDTPQESTPTTTPNNIQDPVQNRLQDQETGYYQADMVYSDTDEEDEEMPQVKLEKDVHVDDGLPPQEPSSQKVDGDGDIQPRM